MQGEAPEALLSQCQPFNQTKNSARENLVFTPLYGTTESKSHDSLMM